MARTKQTARKTVVSTTRTRLTDKPVPKISKGVGGVKKPHRFRPGTVALREIRKLQKDEKEVLAMAPFVRLVREIVRETHGQDMRIQADAIGALKQACESFIVTHFEHTQNMAVHAKRVTILQRDSQLVTRTMQASNVSVYMSADGGDDGRVTLGSRKNAAQPTESAPSKKGRLLKIKVKLPAQLQTAATEQAEAPAQKDLLEDMPFF